MQKAEKNIIKYLYMNIYLWKRQRSARAKILKPGPLIVKSVIFRPGPTRQSNWSRPARPTRQVSAYTWSPSSQRLLNFIGDIV